MSLVLRYGRHRWINLFCFSSVNCWLVPTYFFLFFMMKLMDQCMSNRTLMPIKLLYILVKLTLFFWYAWWWFFSSHFSIHYPYLFPSFWSFNFSSKRTPPHLTTQSWIAAASYPTPATSLAGSSTVSYIVVDRDRYGRWTWRV